MPEPGAAFPDIGTMSLGDVLRFRRQEHLRDNPDCPYSDRPHYVPPGSGTPGFYACQPPNPRKPSRPSPTFATDHGVAFRCRNCNGYLYSDQPTRRVAWYRGWLNPWRRFVHVDCDAKR